MSENALQNGLIVCHCCNKVFTKAHEHQRCNRCGYKLHGRIPHSIAHTWALLITAAFLLVPANVLPIMTLKSLGQGGPATILEGVMQLMDHGMYGIALVVLTASVIIPILKILGLIILLLAVQCGWTTNLRQKMWMYRFVEWIGRWSMLDVFVVAILAAIVQLGSLASVTGNAGATAFGASVVLTMLAAHSFDTRLIWDKRLEQLGVFP